MGQRYLRSAIFLGGLLALASAFAGLALAQSPIHTLTPASGPPGTTVSVTSSSSTMCILILLTQTVVWDGDQVVGQVEGNSCTGWRGSFTVPVDASPGLHTVSTSSGSGQSDELGKFLVDSPPPPSPPTSRQDTIYWVRDNGIRCVVAPCFTYDLVVVNSQERHTVSAVDLSQVGASPEQIEAATRGLTTSGTLVAGTIQPQPNAGPAGEGRVLVASQFYLAAST